MKTELTRFKHEDVREIETNAADDSLVGLIPEDFKNAEKQKHSFTLRMNGRVVAVGGIIEYWPTRGEAWVVSQSKLNQAEALALHRVVKRYLEATPYRRIEAVVCKSFFRAIQWVERLGFTLEAETLRHYSATGQDYSLYARIQ